MQTTEHALIDLDEEYLDSVSGGHISFRPTISFGGSGAYLVASTGTGAWVAISPAGAVGYAGQNGAAIAIGFLAGPITITL